MDYDLFRLIDHSFSSFHQYFRSTKDKFYSKLNEEQNLRKLAKSLYIFLTRPDEVAKYVKIMQSSSSDNCIHRYNVDILNIFDPDIQLINTKLTIFFKKIKNC